MESYASRFNEISCACVQMESAGTVLSTNWKDVGKRKVEASPPDDVEHRKYWARAALSAFLLLFKVIKLVRLSSGGNPDALLRAWQPTSPPHVSAFFLFFSSLSAGSQRSHSPFPKPQMAYSLKKLITNWVRLILNKGRHTWREAGVTDRPETSLLESLCFSVFSKRPSCLAAFIT